jgi:hypothetical protein
MRASWLVLWSLASPSLVLSADKKYKTCSGESLYLINKAGL